MSYPVVTGYTLHSLARPRTFHQFAVTIDFYNLDYDAVEKNLLLPEDKRKLKFIET